MKIYLVGGAVRDKLLGLESKDKDWVVVGATQEQMLRLGLIKITASFPIFIDPKTKQQYALARSEKKISKGYHGFEVNFSKSVTLVDDLRRRDLRVNSIAIDKDNNLIDPFNGQQDIENRILRHTSKAFAEDPLRVIRLARLRAQLSDFKFSIAPETRKFVQQIIKSGELNYLTRERLHIEFTKSLKNPYTFFETLDDLDALSIVFPTVKKYLCPTIDNHSFDSSEYINSTKDQKITLLLINFSSQKVLLNLLRKELILTNRQFKLLVATINIREILKNHMKSATMVLKYLKDANMLRNKTLFQDSFEVYQKYMTITKVAKKQTKSYDKLKRIISLLNNLDVKSVVAKTPKTKLKTSLDKLYVDTVKNQLKIC